MITLSKEQLMESLKPLLKEQGFKKKATTWRKTTNHLILVLNIQGSQWSKEDYYINAAIYIKALGNEENPPEYRCHITDRIDHNEKPFSSVYQEIINWFERYGDIQNLKMLNQEDSLPLTKIDAKKYLNEIQQINPY